MGKLSTEKKINRVYRLNNMLNVKELKLGFRQ